MRIPRELHLLIGGLAIIFSGAFSWGRYLLDGEHGRSVVAVSIIFGTVVSSVLAVLMLEPLDPKSSQGRRWARIGNAGVVWLALLFAAVVIFEGVDRSMLAEPALKLTLATLAGVGLGVYFGPRLSLGPDSDDRFRDAWERRRRREGR